MKPSDIDQIEKILGIKFSDRSLIEQAFTHKSKSMSISKNNERLEFLGDRVLGLVIAGILSNESMQFCHQTLYKFYQIWSLNRHSLPPAPLRVATITTAVGKILS